MATRCGPTSSDNRVKPGSDHGSHLNRVDLERWFVDNGRDLPWRRTRDPWKIVVAELMLQQTQVARVVDRWSRFLQRFPTVHTCAAAPVGDVIDEWSGLGYNRRAVFLHRMAVDIAANHRGRFPSELKPLLALPGIGQYTARAVLVFAFEQREAVLDTNVARILARTVGRSLGPKEAQSLADAALGRDSWTWNQAMLDVGAGYCTARAPLCERCPLASVCAWYRAERPEPDPAGGSAGVSGRQSRFKGSDRQGRGKLVAAMRNGSVSAADLPTVMGWPDEPDRAARVAATLVADGLARVANGAYSLPD